jgi:NTE family protein
VSVRGLEGRELSLALSGGGVRAMAFHAGALRHLAELRLLEQVAQISSVSGGSLLVGLVLGAADCAWPSSEQYAGVVLPRIRTALTQNDLGSEALKRLLAPANWKYLLSRANVVAAAIEKAWRIDARLADLPDMPVWSVNATTSETGRRFRFKKTGVGDYELGYAAAAGFKVAEAMAVSAAFPGVIGPFVIETAAYDWYKREAWGLPKEAAERKPPPFAHLHLYDGGVYDNLGTEPHFDSGLQRSKEGSDFLVVSDAGAPFAPSAPGWFRPFRLKRVADIMSEQTRALRVRSFVNFLRSHPRDGAYLQIGADPKEKLSIYRDHNRVVAEALSRDTWLADDAVRRSAAYATTLLRMREVDFDLLERHGYETAKWNLALFQDAGVSAESETRLVGIEAEADAPR